MTIKEAQFIQNLMENAGEECEINASYSGRGMFGTSTIGVMIESELLLISVLLAELQLTNENEGGGGKVPIFGNLRHDSMGTQIIIY